MTLPTINWAQVWNVGITGFVLGIGVSAGVLSFCLVSVRAVLLTRWLRQRVLAIGRWSRLHASP
ncbi:MAG TPA: hypothetical protein VF764_09030 [Steroidobacteraceae bacterium]